MMVKDIILALLVAWLVLIPFSGLFSTSQQTTHNHYSDDKPRSWPAQSRARQRLALRVVAKRRQRVRVGRDRRAG